MEFGLDFPALMAGRRSDPDSCGEAVEFAADLSAIVVDSYWLDRLARPPISGASREVFLAAARAVELRAASDPVPF